MEAGQMFGLSWAEIAIIVAVGMFVLGPERIPVAVKWVGSTLKTVRTMAAGAQEQLRGEFGPELEELRRQIADLQSLKEIQDLRSLRDLNPRALITKNILGDDFSGGITGILGLNAAKDVLTTSNGVGLAAPPVSAAVAAESSALLPETEPAHEGVPPEKVQADNHWPVPSVSINEPAAVLSAAVPTSSTAAPRHLAVNAYDLDAT